MYDLVVVRLRSRPASPTVASGVGGDTGGMCGHDAAEHDLSFTFIYFLRFLAAWKKRRFMGVHFEPDIVRRFPRMVLAEYPSVMGSMASPIHDSLFGSLPFLCGHGSGCLVHRCRKPSSVAGKWHEVSSFHFLRSRDSINLFPPATDLEKSRAFQNSHIFRGDVYYPVHDARMGIPLE